ncbi:hypothetical protein [Bacillus suaedae]|uniref:Endolytic transglycosylase MltG n=1 Tax=Halalkalibacter suaedae TaxID=2822140 RepID=A0A940WTQ1_9BACI|nr:hypothetical protein [Bacillus suaedae]MBP3950462.1 hypothetical protein [Bacillus suaedae]
MTANSIRSFASGLLLAACLCGAVYFLGPSGEAKSTEEVQPIASTDELKAKLTEEGYVTITTEEWSATTDALKALQEIEDDSSAAEVEGEENVASIEKEVIIYRTILTVTPGMTSIDVGEALVRANIINKAIDFFNEVEKQGLANELKPGTFEVDSEMSLQEVISIIF